MSTPPKQPAAPGSAESLGLEKKIDDPVKVHEQDGDRTEEKGEPFDGNFA